jgi:hypothetical protein
MANQSIKKPAPPPAQTIRNGVKQDDYTPRVKKAEKKFNFSVKSFQRLWQGLTA